HRVADELVAVQIPFTRTLGPRDRDRERLGEPDVVRHAPRKQPPRPGIERLRLRILPRPAGNRTVGVMLCATPTRVTRPQIPHKPSPAQHLHPPQPATPAQHLHPPQPATPSAAPHPPTATRNSLRSPPSTRTLSMIKLTSHCLLT